MVLVIEHMVQLLCQFGHGIAEAVLVIRVCLCDPLGLDAGLRPIDRFDYLSEFLWVRSAVQRMRVAIGREGRRGGR